MAEPAPPSPGTTERQERALIAFLRQEINAPAAAILGFLDMLLEDARKFGLADLVPDFERMRAASLNLGRIVDQLAMSLTTTRKPEEDFTAFQNRLRHDLRTPLNAIKGYGELILEDIAGGPGEPLRHDLERVKSASDRLLAQIDQGLDPSSADQHPIASDGGKTPPAAIVADLLQAVPPISEQFGLDRVISSRILVVDDTASNRDLLTRRLLRDGHQIFTAEDGASALALIESEPFDLVLLDLMMPGMSGFEVLCRLKSDARARHVPVIVISALDELDMVVRCVEAGAEDYLPKPFNPTLLRARINASLERKWLRDREREFLEQLRAEKQKSEALLLNILPQTIVSRMRDGETLIADRFGEATILFTDIVDFTGLANGLTPERTVETLSTVFSSFDRLVSEQGLEKIKTIGDAYMVAGGIPNALPDHALRVAKLALRMLEEVEVAANATGLDLKIRIGVHTGAVVAGVIGTHKFVYDVWGDTVNTASRMESHGSPGRIHVSASTRLAVGDAFTFEPRGPIALKGKGLMETYFLMGRAD